MELSEFNYELPEELIAQTPIEKRDESRLMILDKNTGKIEHKIFKEIIPELYQHVYMEKKKLVQMLNLYC